MGARVEAADGEVEPQRQDDERQAVEGQDVDVDDDIDVNVDAAAKPDALNRFAFFPTPVKTSWLKSIPAFFYFFFRRKPIVGSIEIGKKDRDRIWSRCATDSF